MVAAGSPRLVVAANRLPVAWSEESGEWEPSPGGLVSALAPVLSERGGTWVGWPGTGRKESPGTLDGIRLVPVSLDDADIEEYYDGFCNGTVWPLYHDAIRPVEFHRQWWRRYVDVNSRFADAVAAADPAGPIWVQDYQLQLVPEMVRSRLGGEPTIGFFLHVPFPPIEIFSRLPWRREIIRGLLGADLVGFHTRQAVLNFARAARELGEATGPAHALSYEGRVVRAGAFPISIDPAEHERLAGDPGVRAEAAEIRAGLGSPDTVLFGVDRLDYTKGIDQRLAAYETLLRRREDLRRKISLVQVAVPSREAVGEYQTIREVIEQLVGRINGELGEPGWVPVHYLYRSLSREQLAAYYVAADVMVVTPLRDGMNLVAKEYVVSRLGDDGVLVLSEFAGAAEQLSEALIVNPYDVDGLSFALERAVGMGAGEQRARMRRLRRKVIRWDVHRWASEFLAALGGGALGDGRSLPEDTDGRR